jgi:hypothetical protein
MTLPLPKHPGRWLPPLFTAIRPLLQQIGALLVAWLAKNV